MSVKSILLAGVSTLFVAACQPQDQVETVESPPVPPVEEVSDWSKGAMVAAADPRAVEAGLEVLRNGGHAVDAAIAVHTVLGLVEPQSSGIGGGAFMVPYIIAFILLGIPLMWVEWALGRYGGRHGHGTTPAIFGLIWDSPIARILGALLIPAATQFVPQPAASCVERSTSYSRRSPTANERSFDFAMVWSTATAIRWRNAVASSK